MGLKPLGIVKEAVEAAGMAVSYVYEDLVFIDHNAFLLQFTDSDDEILIHFNQAVLPSEIDETVARLRNEAEAREIQVHDGGHYTISQEGDQNIRLEFIE